MKIIIVGCGKIGTMLISSLVSEGHDIIAVDIDNDELSKVNNIYDIMSICGNGADSDILLEAGVSDADIFIAVTSSDELNMLSCFLAKRLGAGNTIARIRSPEYNDSSLEFVKKELELSLSINPERLAARELYNILKFPSAAKIEKFSGHSFEMIEINLKPDSPLDGVSLKDLRSRSSAKVLICCVQRGEEVFIPDGNFVLKSGDRIDIAASTIELQKLLRDTGKLQKQTKNVMILGGSRIARYLAEMLISSGASVKIVEKDEKICADLCDALPKAVVIRGDGAEQELLIEEGLKECDGFVSLTGLDENNILISIFAASQNVPKVIPKVNHDELVSMAERLGVESVITPKKIVSDVIVRYARALNNSRGSNVETLYKIMGGSAEALEFGVHPDSRLIGIPLKELDLKSNILIAGITRGRKTIIPAGDDVILSGDHVIVIAADERLCDLDSVLK